MPMPFSILTHPISHAIQKALGKTLLVVVSACVAIALITPVSEAAPAKRKAPTVQKGKYVKSAKAAPRKGGKAVKTVKTTKGMKGFKTKAGGKYKRVVYYVPAPPSVGLMSGLHNTPDPLALKSSVALVVDANTSQVLFEKNANTALPIASITKLMTALVVVEAQQALNEILTINAEDVNLEQRVRSKLNLGTEMTRRDALQLALMASENRAANMLSRYYPGGKPAFVDAMNRKAAQLGMSHSAFVEGTGLASANVASASDLVKLVKAAKQHSIIRELSTQVNYDMVDSSGRVRGFHTTNRLIANPGWDITLQKTGFINAAGQCLVMATNLDGRPIIMVFLDSAGKLSRLGDAQRVRDWLAANPIAVAIPSKPVVGQLLTPPTRGVGSVVEPKAPLIAWSKAP
jgi:serine-type D-Ala-D-Ala endopeptidase (penicillin-binding protein 7)